jgi:hypothetical protein
MSITPGHREVIYIVLTYPDTNFEWVGVHHIYSAHQKYVDKYKFTNKCLDICSDSSMYLKIIIYLEVKGWTDLLAGGI